MMKAAPTWLLYVLITCMGYSCAGQSADLTPAEFKDFLNKQNLVLIDVRTSQEQSATGVIQGAKQIDFAAPNFKDALLALDKSKTYLIYCAVGGRSGQAAQVLQANGVKAYNLQGGINAWSAAGYPLSPVK